MRVFLVTHYLPPYDRIASARTGRTAKYLERFGHDVRVIAARDTVTPFTEMPVEIHPYRVVYTRWSNAIFKIDLGLNAKTTTARIRRAVFAWNEPQTERFRNSRLLSVNAKYITHA